MTFSQPDLEHEKLMVNGGDSVGEQPCTLPAKLSDSLGDNPKDPSVEKRLRRFGKKHDD